MSGVSMYATTICYSAESLACFKLSASEKGNCMLNIFQDPEEVGDSMMPISPSWYNSLALYTTDTLK